jgi:hypothetical protein
MEAGTFIGAGGISPRRLLAYGVERFSQLSVSTQSRIIPLHPDTLPNILLGLGFLGSNLFE